eukprot:CCRYP_014459-RA/>CCRYP_014459-RA protein AED:0.69 eAED:0.20 QI:0/0/0/0.5/1/1/2/0/510
MLSILLCPPICLSIPVGRQPTPSFTITLAGIPAHVGSKFVSGNIDHFHLVTNPLSVVSLVSLVPETAVLWSFGVRLAARKLFAMRARVGRMTRVAVWCTSLATTSSATSIVAFVVPSTVTLAIVVFVVGGSIAVGLHGRGSLSAFRIGSVVLLLEELGEQGDLIGDGVGGAGGCRGIVELAYAVGASELLQDGSNGGGVVGMVVGELAPDGLEGWAEFASPVMAACDVNVGEEDKSKLGVVGGDAVGGHPAGFGAKNGEFLVEVKFKLDDLEELGEDFSGVQEIGALDDGGKDFFEEPVVNTAEIGAVGSFEDCIGDIRSYFCGDSFGGALFGSDDSLVHRRDCQWRETQFSPDPDNSPLLPTEGIKHVQDIVGALLFYAHAINNKLLHALSDIGTKQASTTGHTNDKINQLLDYCATYPNNGITHRSSNMILSAHSDAAYFNASKSCSRTGAHIMCSENDVVPSHNGPVLTIAQIIKFVTSSAAESKLAALFICTKKVVPLRQSLIEMG